MTPPPEDPPPPLTTLPDEPPLMTPSDDFLGKGKFLSKAFRDPRDRPERWERAKKMWEDGRTTPTHPPHPTPTPTQENVGRRSPKKLWEDRRSKSRFTPTHLRAQSPSP